MPDEIRISLSLEDFRALVNGNEVSQDGVKIILQDIGFSKMRMEIDDAHKNLLS